MAVLQIHYGVAYLIVLVSLAALFARPLRRVVLYLLVLQIVLGATVWAVTHLAPPPLHWILAIFNGGTYAMANAFERRGRPAAMVTTVVGIGFVIFAYVFYLGMHALRT